MFWIQDLLRQDARIQDFYFNISEMKPSTTLLFSVQIMSYLGASDIIYFHGVNHMVQDLYFNISEMKASIQVTVFSTNNVILRGIRYNKQRCDL